MWEPNRNLSGILGCKASALEPQPVGAAAGELWTLDGLGAPRQLLSATKGLRQDVEDLYTAQDRTPLLLSLFLCFGFFWSAGLEQQRVNLRCTRSYQYVSHTKASL